MDRLSKEDTYQIYNHLCLQGQMQAAEVFLQLAKRDEEKELERIAQQQARADLSDCVVDEEDYAILEQAREEDPTKLSQRQIDELIKGQP